MEAVFNIWRNSEHWTRYATVKNYMSITVVFVVFISPWNGMLTDTQVRSTTSNTIPVVHKWSTAQ